MIAGLSWPSSKVYYAKISLGWLPNATSILTISGFAGDMCGHGNKEEEGGVRKG